MSQHRKVYVISYHGTLCHDMSYVTTIVASLLAKMTHYFENVCSFVASSHLILFLLHGSFSRVNFYFILFDFLITRKKNIEIHSSSDLRPWLELHLTLDRIYESLYCILTALIAVYNLRIVLVL